MKKHSTWYLYIAILPLAFCIWWPVWYIVTGALRSSAELVLTAGAAVGLENTLNPGTSWSILPSWPTLQPLCELLLDTPSFFVMFWNSMIQTVPLLLGQLLVAAPAGWALSRYTFKGKRVVQGLYLILMLLPFQVTMVPNYLVLDGLGLLNTHWAIILPGIFAGMPVFLMSRGFDRVSASCIEAAKLDGANSLVCFLRIGVPMGKEGIFTAMTLAFLDAWNSLEQPMTYLQDQSLWPLSLFLPQITAENFGLAAAASFLIMLPPLLAFWIGHNSLLSELERGTDV